MKNNKLIISWVIIFMSLNGCAMSQIKTNLPQEKHVGNISSPIIKDDLNGLSDEQIKAYFNQCIANNLIFLYRGGYTGGYLVDKSDFGFAKTFKWVGIGCTGGVEEGYKFNKLVIDYVKNKPETKTITRDGETN